MDPTDDAMDTMDVDETRGMHPIKDEEIDALYSRFDISRTDTRLFLLEPEELDLLLTDEKGILRDESRPRKLTINEETGLPYVCRPAEDASPDRLKIVTSECAMATGTRSTVSKIAQRAQNRLFWALAVMRKEIDFNSLKGLGAKAPQNPERRRVMLGIMLARGERRAWRDRVSQLLAKMRELIGDHENSSGGQAFVVVFGAPTGRVWICGNKSIFDRCLTVPVEDLMQHLLQDPISCKHFLDIGIPPMVVPTEGDGCEGSATKNRGKGKPFPNLMKATMQNLLEEYIALRFRGHRQAWVAYHGASRGSNADGDSEEEGDEGIATTTTTTDGGDFGGYRNHFSDSEDEAPAKQVSKKHPRSRKSASTPLTAHSRIYAPDDGEKLYDALEAGDPQHSHRTTTADSAPSPGKTRAVAIKKEPIDLLSNIDVEHLFGTHDHASFVKVKEEEEESDEDVSSTDNTDTREAIVFNSDMIANLIASSARSVPNQNKRRKLIVASSVAEETTRTTGFPLVDWIAELPAPQAKPSTQTTLQFSNASCTVANKNVKKCKVIEPVVEQ